MTYRWWYGLALPALAGIGTVGWRLIAGEWPGELRGLFAGAAGTAIVGVPALIPVWLQLRREGLEQHASRLTTFDQRDAVNRQISELEDSGPHDDASARATELKLAVEHREYLTSVLAQQTLLEEAPTSGASVHPDAAPASKAELERLRDLLDESILATDILDAPGWNARGFALYRAERFDQALKALDRSLALDDQATAVHLSRYLVLEKLGRHEEALASADRTIELSPEDWLGFTSRGVALGRLGRHEEEFSAFDRATELNSSPGNRYNRSCALSMLGRFQESIEEIELALASGYEEWALIESDDELDPLRSDPEYGPRLRELIDRYKNADDNADAEDETTED